MAVRFGDLELEGPFSTLEELIDAPGVYALLCLNEDTGDFKLLQVKTTTLIQTEVARTLRDDWSSFCQGKIRVAVFYGEENLDQIREQIFSTADVQPF
jgi:hypothetical protein